MKKQRPINLDLQTVHFPITAIASILHRISGVITFISISLLLWLLGHSLSSAQGFAQVMALMHSVVMKFIFWLILTLLLYHICAGIRHLLMDFGYLEESFEAGCRSAKIAFIVTVILSILVGGMIW